MAQAEQQSGGGKRKWLTVLIIVVVASAMTAGVTAFFLSRSKNETNEAAVTGVEEKAEKNTRYHPLDPSFIVNFDSGKGRRGRLLQVSITLLLSDERAEEFLKKHDPMIRNNILLVLSAQDPEQLLTVEGKERLRAAVLDEVKNIRNKIGAFTGGIEDVFFTSFVMQ